MITLGSSENTSINSGGRGVAWLVDMDFSTGMVRVTTAPVNVVDGGNTYTGVGNIGTVSEIKESGDTGDQKVTVGISVANSAYLASVLGNVANYRNRAITISLGIFDDKFQLVGSKVPRWSGRMEKVNIKRNKDGGTVEMECCRTGMPRSRVAQGLRLSHAQQQLLFPGDMGLQYIRTLIEKPTLWLSKRFQQQ